MSEISDAERLRYLQLKQKLGATTPVPKPDVKDAEPFYEDFGEGVVASGMDTYYGVKSLFTELDDEDTARLKDWQEDAAESNWGTAGNVVGEIAQIVGTGGLGGAAVKGGLKMAAMQAAKSAAKNKRSMVRGLGKVRKGVTPLTADIAASGLVSGAGVVGEGETRGENAVAGARDALVGGVAAKGLSKAVSGISKTKEAQKLLDDGIPLTPAQASTGTGVQGLENSMQVIFSLSKGRHTARANAVTAWAKQAMQEAAPKGVKISGTARERADMLKNSYTKAYNGVWAKGKRPTNEVFVGMQDAITAGGRFVGKDAEPALKKISSDIKKLSGDYSPTALKNLDHTLKKNIRRMARAGDDAAETALNNVRLKLRESLPTEAKKELLDLDANYGKYLVVKKAGANAKESKGSFTPKQFMDSVKQVGGETRTFIGTAPLQGYADAALASVGRIEPAILQDINKGVIAKTPTHQPTMDAMGRAVLGETAPQKALNRVLQSPLADRLRKMGVRGGAAGGAIGQQD